MEFWGIEVKPGQTVKCVPGDERLLHLSQASLGEVKKDKGSENVPIFVNINNQKLVLGTLSGDSCAQIQYDLVFEKDFELSHDSKNTSVFFVGYKSFNQDFESEDDFYDSDSEDDLQINQKTNGKAVVKNEPSKPNSGRVNVGKTDESSKAKAQPGKPENADKPKAEEEEDDDDDDDEDSDDDNDDEKMAAAMMEGDNEDESSEEDEDATPKAENDKKRSSAGGSKSPILEKKAKVVTPTGKQKAGGDGKKGGHVATPHPAKQAGKTPAAGDKPKQQQTPKSAGSIACKSCSKKHLKIHIYEKE